MISQKKTALIRSKWDNMFTFRLDLQKYLKSLDRIHKSKLYIKCHQEKNLSQTENSGYNYSPIL